MVGVLSLIVVEDSPATGGFSLSCHPFCPLHNSAETGGVGGVTVGTDTVLSTYQEVVGSQALRQLCVKIHCKPFIVLWGQ